MAPSPRWILNSSSSDTRGRMGDTVAPWPIAYRNTSSDADAVDCDLVDALALPPFPEHRRDGGGHGLEPSEEQLVGVANALEQVLRA